VPAGVTPEVVAMLIRLPLMVAKAPAGRPPVTEYATDPDHPFDAVAVTVYVPVVCPAVTVCELGDTDKLKSGVVDVA
jgi:hypothetical protein